VAPYGSRAQNPRSADVFSATGLHPRPAGRRRREGERAAARSPTNSCTAAVRAPGAARLDAHVLARRLRVYPGSVTAPSGRSWSDGTAPRQVHSRAACRAEGSTTQFRASAAGTSEPSRSRSSEGRRSERTSVP
jgi:hypothetical protein